MVFKEQKPEHLSWKAMALPPEGQGQGARAGQRSVQRPFSGNKTAQQGDTKCRGTGAGPGTGYPSPTSSSTGAPWAGVEPRAVTTSTRQRPVSDLTRAGDANEVDWNKIKVFRVQNTGMPPWGGSCRRPALPLAQRHGCGFPIAAQMTTAARGRPTASSVEIPSLFYPAVQGETK